MILRLGAAAALVSLCAWGADPGETFVWVSDQKTSVQNEARAAVRFSPCSTFKIPNSLIALETGVATDAAFPLEYDPKRDGPQTGAWSRNHDLRSAMRNSVVWFFQEIARRVGSDRMREWVNRFEYGNMSTEPQVDRFWLGQGLRISAKEQVDFLSRFISGRLPVSSRSVAIVKDTLLLETTREYRWYGKTGTCSSDGQPWVAWHVGFIERDGSVAVYAMNLAGSSFPDVASRRNTRVREQLAAVGLISAVAPSAAEQMRARIERAVEAFPGTVSLFAKNLDTRESFAIRPDEPVRTASTIKLPIMAAVFSAVAQGRARWDDTVEMRAADKVSGSGVIRELADGTKLTLRDLVHMMIVVSDNTATNLLLKRFTTSFVNDEIRKLGLKETQSLRKILSPEQDVPEPLRRFGIGVSTPREMVTLLEKLESGDVVNPEASREMLAILGRQQYKDGIGRRLPSEEVASKSGALDRLRSDVGLVRSTGGRVAVAMTVDDMRRTDYSADNAGSLLISKLTGYLLEGSSAPLRELLQPEAVTELRAEMDHVQGIEVDGDRLWVTWVDRNRRTGHLGEFNLQTGALVRSVEIHKGERFHPGGLAGDGQSLWIPVAEYKANSSALIQKRNRDTLELESEFEVGDHIGCIAAAGDLLYGGNWDAREIYTWNRSGHLIEKRPNPTGTSMQDLKIIDGELIGGGLRRNEGAIDFLDAATLRLRRRIRTGRSDRGVVLTHEGMAIRGGKLYLLPEDQPSRLFVFPLEQ